MVKNTDYKHQKQQAVSDVQTTEINLKIQKKNVK